MIAPGRPKRSATARRSSAGAAPRTAAPEGASPDGAAPRFEARLVTLDPGFYAFGLTADDTSWRSPVAGLALPAVQVCAVPHQDGEKGGPPGGAVEITDSSGHAGSWLGGRRKVLFVKAPAGGGVALVTGYLARDPGSMPLELEIRRVGPPAPVMTLKMGGPVASERSPSHPGLDIVAHIRGRGDVRFQATPWVGRLGPGLWIEAFMILARGQSAAAAIEYKGLTASGAETPWTGSGGLCGSRGLSTPLIGFAVRQKAVPDGALVDCEYTGYFQSGAVAGPARNGAPCRSAIENDPLEGMQLRITPRPATPASAD
jgi:hypothetical protein